MNDVIFKSVDDLYIDVSLNKVITLCDGKKLDHLRIQVIYDKGGLSWYGDSRNKGIFLIIAPIGKYESSIMQVYDGKIDHEGFSVFCFPCGRKSPSKMRKIYDLVVPHATEIRDMFENKEYIKIHDLVMIVSGKI